MTGEEKGRREEKEEEDKVVMEDEQIAQADANPRRAIIIISL